MSKPVTMTLDVEEIAMGRVWRMLDNMPGVISIRLHGSGPRPAKGKSGKKGKVSTVYCIVLKALIEANKPTNRDTLRDILAKSGKSATSLPDALTKLRKAKHIIAKNAMYSVTPAGRKFYETSCPVIEE